MLERELRLEEDQDLFNILDELGTTTVASCHHPLTHLEYGEPDDPATINRRFACSHGGGSITFKQER